MRIKITAGGIYGAEGELPIGTELTVESPPAGWAGRYIDLDEHRSTNDGERDENGDTPEMAELRKQFDARYLKQGTLLTEAQTKIGTLEGRITALQVEAEAKDRELASLRSAAATKTAPAYTVLNKGSGWYAITLDGKEVTKSLRQDDVKDFDKMSDADKAALVDLHKPD